MQRPKGLKRFWNGWTVCTKVATKMSSLIPYRTYFSPAGILHLWIVNALCLTHSAASSLPLSFNAIIDAWARSGDRMAPRRAEQILDHMDELYRAGNKGVKPDTYTYNTLINCW